MLPLLVTSLAIFVVANVFFLAHILFSTSHTVHVLCQFRRYPPHRYFLLQEQPEFLITEYIYGEWPKILPTKSAPQKLCVDQSEWHQPSNSERPFADGTNPSILSMARIKQHESEHSQQQQQQGGVFSSHVPTGTSWVTTICMTNSQCAWKDSPQQIRDYSISTQTQPDTVRTVLLFLDDQFVPLEQRNIYLYRDAPWGKRGRATEQQYTLPALDDARLFVHNGQVWVSYREGPAFGYDTQVLNPIHLEDSTRAVIKASETTSFCCGRNMALMEDRSNPNKLLSLTWVDPITVITVDTDVNHRRLTQQKQTRHSHIHGTNAFMLYWEEREVFLGVAHFHRPNDRKPNPYARFGHHYTHAFYTVSSHAPYRLTALSAEFVLPAVHNVNDAEIIQFASGIEWDKENLIIVYGINDCESAVTKIDIEIVRQWLRPVQQGTEVIDYMKHYSSQ